MKSPERTVVPPATMARMKLPGQMELRRRTDRNWPEIIRSVSKAAKEILRTEIKMEIAAKNKMAEATMANRLPPKASKMDNAVRAKVKLEMDNAAIAASSLTVIIIMASKLRLETTVSAGRAATISNRQIIIRQDRKIIPASPEKTGSNKADRMAAEAMRIVCGNSPSGWDRIIIEPKTTAARSPETVL